MESNITQRLKIFNFCRKRKFIAVFLYYQFNLVAFVLTFHQIIRRFTTKTDLLSFIIDNEDFT